jgi:hypothetical protein
VCNKSHKRDTVHIDCVRTSIKAPSDIDIDIDIYVYKDIDIDVDIDIDIDLDIGIGIDIDIDINRDIVLCSSNSACRYYASLCSGQLPTPNVDSRRVFTASLWRCAAATRNKKAYSTPDSQRRLNARCED